MGGEGKLQTLENSLKKTVSTTAADVYNFQHYCEDTMGVFERQCVSDLTT